MASHGTFNDLDEIQLNCLRRLLREANLLPNDDKTNLDTLVEKSCKAVQEAGSLAPTLSDQLWNGELDGEPSFDPCSGDKQPTRDTTVASSSSSSKTDVRGHGSFFQRKMNWNKWEPDPNSAEQLLRRTMKDWKNRREMERKKRKKLHV